MVFPSGSLHSAEAGELGRWLLSSCAAANPAKAKIMEVRIAPRLCMTISFAPSPTILRRRFPGNPQTVLPPQRVLRVCDKGGKILLRRHAGPLFFGKSQIQRGH